MRNLAFVALSIGAIGLLGCGDDGGSGADANVVVFADAAVGVDGGGGGADATVLNCNPATNVGCGPNEKCGVIVQSGDPNFLTTTDCVAEGDKQLGDACAFDGTVADGATGISDCVGGTECNGGVCVKVCDGEATPSDCPQGEICQSYNGFYSGTAFGWCEPTCDPVGDDGAGNQLTGCNKGDGCYVNIFSLGSICGGPFCDASNLCGHDDDCQYINACNPGKTCSVLNAAQDGLLCAKLCIPPAVAMGLTEMDLPLADDPSHNGQAPWACSRLNDGGGQDDDALLHPGYVCIPLGGDDAIRYWGDLTTMDGWPYASAVGVCVSTDGGSPYTFDPNAGAALGQSKFKPKMGAKQYMEQLRNNPDFDKIINYIKDHQ